MAKDVDLSVVTRVQVDRFLSKIDTTSGLGPEGDCHIWCGSKDRDGYGQLGVGSRKDGTLGSIRTHRLMWKLSHPDELMLPGICICHTCDNPICVNVLHLFPGTNQQNVADKVRKGRSACGDRNGSRLHPERLARGDRNGARTHPEKWARGDSHWSRKHPERMARGDRHGRALLTERDVICIRSDVDISHRECARYYGVAPSTIGAIRRGLIWKHVGGVLPLSAYRDGREKMCQNGG